MLAIVFSIALFSCKKSGISYQNTGIITGEDDRMCSFCGGYYITIDNKDYRFWSLPANSNIKLANGQYPISVALNWHKDTAGRIPDMIIVDAVQKIW